MITIDETRHPSTLITTFYKVCFGWGGYLFSNVHKIAYRLRFGNFILKLKRGV